MEKQPLPIEHLSYSALMQFLRNPFEFRRIYIEKKYRERQTPALVVGKAFHKCMEIFYKGHSKEQALEMGFHLIHDAEETIDFGETGSMDKLLEDYRKTVEHYWQDGEKLIDAAHVRAAEQKMVAESVMLPLPLKAVADLVLEHPEEKTLRVIDFKKVSSLSDPEGKPKPEYFIQASFLFWTAMNAYGKVPLSVDFLEVKTSKNKDGSPQCQLVSVKFDDPEVQKQMDAVEMLISHVCRQLMDMHTRKALFLPNPADLMNGEESWDEFVQAVA